MNGIETQESVKYSLEPSMSLVKTVWDKDGKEVRFKEKANDGANQSNNRDERDCGSRYGNNRGKGEFTSSVCWAIDDFAAKIYICRGRDGREAGVGILERVGTAIDKDYCKSEL